MTDGGEKGAVKEMGVIWNIAKPATVFQQEMSIAKFGFVERTECK